MNAKKHLRTPVEILLICTENPYVLGSFYMTLWSLHTSKLNEISFFIFDKKFRRTPIAPDLG